MILLPLLLAAAPMGTLPVFQDTGGLDRAVAAFTSRPIGAEGGARTAIDTRLRLAQCPTVSLARPMPSRTQAKYSISIRIALSPCASGQPADSPSPL